MTFAPDDGGEDIPKISDQEWPAFREGLDTIKLNFWPVNSASYFEDVKLKPIIGAAFIVSVSTRVHRNLPVCVSDVNFAMALAHRDCSKVKVGCSIVFRS